MFGRLTPRLNNAAARMRQMRGALRCAAGTSARSTAMRVVVSSVGATNTRARVSGGVRAYHASAIVAAGGSSATPTSGVIPFVLADIGEGIAECEVMKWFVAVGDTIKQFDKVCLVQSDKATVEITSRYDGVVKAIHYKKGDMAKVGSPLIDIDLGGESNGTAAASSSAASAPAAAAAPAAAPAAASVASGSSLDGDKPQASPAVRRIAKENSIDLSLVNPTGPKGRILKEDVQNYLKSGGSSATAAPATSAAAASAVPAAYAPQPAAAPAKGSAPFPAGLPAPAAKDEVVPITGLARIMVKTMNDSNSVPQFGYCDEIVMDGLTSLRDSLRRHPPPTLNGAHTSGTGKDGAVKISYMPFLIKATSMALRQFPQLNAHVNPGCTEVVYRASHNIGLAMDTARGLLVPNIKDVQFKSVWQIAAELNRLQALGKAGMIGRADLTGGTFTLSNIGTIGGTYAKPLVVVPEVMIGALGKIQTLPRYNAAGAVVPQSLMVVSWSADHRVVDGATCARFSNLWKHYIEHPTAMLLDTK